jgi:hypothetical protein
LILLVFLKNVNNPNTSKVGFSWGSESVHYLSFFLADEIAGVVLDYQTHVTSKRMAI